MNSYDEKYIDMVLMDLRGARKIANTPDPEEKEGRRSARLSNVERYDFMIECVELYRKEHAKPIYSVPPISERG